MATVLVNADDFGLHADIDRGIRECIDAGVVQSISFSPQGESLDWDELKRLHHRGVRVGLHLTLVGEPWLSDGRVIPHWKQLVKALALPGRSSRSLRAAVQGEIDAQLERCRANQIELSHIDSHQHVHVFDGIWQPTLAAAQREGIPRVRVPLCPTWSVIKPNVAGIALQLIARRRARQVQNFLPILGVAHAGHNSAAIYRREFAHTSPRDVELCVHPGVNTPALTAKYADWKFDWTGERDALLAPDFRDAVQTAGFELAPLLVVSATA